MKNKIPYNSIFFATFSRYEKGKRLPTNGMVDPICSYFLPKVKSLVMLDLPHLISDTIEPYIEVYASNALVQKYRMSKYLFFPIYLLCLLPSKKETRVSYKLRDFFSVLWVAMVSKQKFDLFIGLESINALAGVILKRLGIVNTVVYYVSDYAPNRFGTSLFNTIYLWLDRICVNHADFTWDVSPAMYKGRILAGLSPLKKYPIIHVPNGLFPNQIAPLPIGKRHRYDVVYMGIMQADMGPDLAIDAFEQVLKEYPYAKLHLIGGSPIDLIPYRKMVTDKKIEKSVTFYGFVPDNIKMANIVRACSVGLAPYRAFPDSLRWYGDAGKIRQYTAAGLPVVTTHVPPLGNVIVKNGAGIMTDDTVASFSEGIKKLFKNKKLYKSLSLAAIRISRDNTWDNVYNKTLGEMI